MKKINSIFRVSSTLLLSLAISAALLSSCASQYHWVKAKSADPKFITKSDSYAQVATPKAVVDKSVNETEKPSSSLATAPDNLNTGMATASTSGDDLVAKATLKAEEIKSALSIERKAALSSSDMVVRENAVRETVHEQLAANAAFNKLSDAKKQKIEDKLTSRTVKMSSAMAARGGSYGGFNKLLLIGLILIVLGVIFFLISGVLGTIFTAIGLVLAILGLVQMLA